MIGGLQIKIRRATGAAEWLLSRSESGNYGGKTLGAASRAQVSSIAALRRRR